MSESFSKKERTKQKARDKQAKVQKMRERKATGNKGKSLDDMMAYLDEYGNLTSTPPGEKRQLEISLDDIQLGAAPIIAEDPVRKGVVSFFNEAKGYGFIIEDKSGGNIFVHVNQLLQPIKEKDRVTFEKERTPRGYNAIKVQKIAK